MMSGWGRGGAHRSPDVAGLSFGQLERPTLARDVGVSRAKLGA